MGNQVWSSKNLDIDHFRNGDKITEVFSIEEWQNAIAEKRPAYCKYDFDSGIGEKYGNIYNWYCISDTRMLAPDGYRIPTNSDWATLIDNIDDDVLKIIDIPEINESNESGFSALPGGFYDGSDEGGFYQEGELAIFWSIAEAEYLGKSDYPLFEEEPQPLYIDFSQDPVIIERGSHSAANVIYCGYYVRCIAASGEK